MIDLVKKSMLTGLGIASITKDKIEEIAKDLIKQGDMSEQEGRKFVEEMMSYAETTKKDIEKYIDNAVKKTIDRLDIVRKSDLDELRASIDEMKRKDTVEDK